MDGLTLALCQRKSRFLAKDENLKIIEGTIASNVGADIYVFPEMFLTSYLIRDKVWDVAEDLNGSSVDHALKIAEEYNTHIVFGMPERSIEIKGLIYNSAVFVSPSGKVQSYKKTYLPNFGPFEEHLYFSQNLSEYPIFCVNGFKIGLEICYDIFFPEISKYYTLKGIDLLICISASPSVTRKFFETILPARAVENTIYVAYANAVGTQRNLVFWGGDTVISPRGFVMAKGKYFKEEVITTKIDVATLELARRLRPTVKDTRPEIVKKLLEVWD